MPSITIIPLTMGHLGQAAGIERECFSDPWSEAMLAAEIENPQSIYLAAVMGGTLAGYAGMQHILDEGYIHNVAVAPAFRRQGVARALVAALIDCARENRLAFLTLEVRESNEAAISLYRSFGFEAVGRRPGYYQKPREDAVLMTLRDFNA